MRFLSAHSLRRARHGHDAAKVTSVELFFDLVFVFAVTQLSHSLLEHLSPIGAVHMVVLLLAVWWAWIYTSWVTNWLDPETLPVRGALLALMLAGLIMSAAIPGAFESSALAFAGAYVTIQVGRTLFMLWALGPDDPSQTRNFQRILTWFCVSALFWIAGALAHDLARLGLWALALGIEFVSPSLGFRVPGLGRSRTEDWDVEGGHLAERCGLFIIIALGESILVTGATFSGLTWTASTIAAFVAAFVGSVAMWWIYFTGTAEAASETIVRSDDPGRVARSAYTYAHLPIIAGVIVSAVADELVLAHPDGHIHTATMVVLLTGPALYLLGNLAFRWAVSRAVPMSHLAGLWGLALLVLAAHVTTPLTITAATSLLFVGLAVWEGVPRKGMSPERDAGV